MGCPLRAALPPILDIGLPRKSNGRAFFGWLGRLFFAINGNGSDRAEPTAQRPCVGVAVPHLDDAVRIVPLGDQQPGRHDQWRCGNAEHLVVKRTNPFPPACCRRDYDADRRS